MKRTNRVISVFSPRCDEEADFETRAQFRAHTPAQFEVTEPGGQPWFESVLRMKFGQGYEQTWLWPGLIPNGQLTVIEGDAGVGKSYVVLDLITRVTRGLPFPQVPGHESVPETPPAPGKVVLITLQDYCTGLAKRLQVLGADLENLHLEGFVARQRADKTRMPSRS
ncbi:MAG: AAA family ATPase, partial [Planctomycetes bacterium]|nr:AAA family ATPase [Planctomycetota bacterium]